MNIKAVCPDRKAYLQNMDELEYNNPEIRCLVSGIRNRYGQGIPFIKSAYHFVRDEIEHSWDICAPDVTCTAAEVLEAGHGNCCGKANLLAAMLRSSGIPCGFCLQFLKDDGELIVHGLNGIRLEKEQRWIRLDARGNKEGVDARFSINTEKLAWPVDPGIGELDYPLILDQFPEPVLRVLRESNTREELQQRWRSELTKERLLPLLPQHNAEHRPGGTSNPHK